MWPVYPAPIEQEQGQVPLYGNYPSHLRMSYPPEYTRQSSVSSMGGPFTGSEISRLSHTSILSTSSIPMSSGKNSSLQGALDASRRMLPYTHVYQAIEGETSSESSPERYPHHTHVNLVRAHQSASYSPPAYKPRGPKMHECEICQKKFPRSVSPILHLLLPATFRN